MDIFSNAEQLRQKLLCDDLNTIIALQQRVFDSISNTICLEPEKKGSPSLDTASCTDTPRTVPSICTLSIGSPLSLNSLSPSSAVQEWNFNSSVCSPTHSQRSFSDVPLGGTLTIGGANMEGDSIGGGSPQLKAFDGKQQQVTLSSHHSFPRSRRCGDPKRDDSKDSKSSLLYNNSCTSTGTASSPNAKRIEKETVKTQGTVLTSDVNAAVSKDSPSTDHHCRSEKLLNGNSFITGSKEKDVSSDEKLPNASENENSLVNSDVDTISVDSISSIVLSEKSVSSDVMNTPRASNDSQNSSKEAKTPPGYVYRTVFVDFFVYPNQFIMVPFLSLHHTVWLRFGLCLTMRGQRKEISASWLMTQS